MEKRVLVLLLLISCVLAAGCEKKEKGKIEEIDNSKICIELADSYYKGHLNNQEYYFSFTNFETDDGGKECQMIFFSNDTKPALYSVTPNGSELILEHIDGPLDTNIKAEFKDGDLYVNDVKLEKTEDLPAQHCSKE